MSILKRILPVCLIILLLLPNISSTAAAASPTRSTTRAIHVNINGAFISTDSNPFIQSGRIMIPIRTLASLGLEYSWDAIEHTVTITNASHDIFQMTQGQPIAYKNGQPVQMDSEANNYNGRIMVPAKFVSEAFGYKVYYDKIREIVFIQSGNFTRDAQAVYSADLKQARLAAISLPILYSFQPGTSTQSDPSQYYTYSFASGDATRYTYSNGEIRTVVEITEGTATAVWQVSEADIPGYPATTFGGMKPEYISDLFKDSFSYNNGVYSSYHTLSDGTVQKLKYSGLNYVDIVRAIPE
ncbi:copper amine oxidase N-terminal domain-containing protein [Paenibacillus tritici]|uniref:copper amine oxidase N-terminal domain-containing protein n=1 Tax=Paenibacillus tritici TaxID=1873425 RepID=UPI001BAD77EA|nr:copper amine oxidase N-terminal domain-containing protein [Paenibacillus tritici]QUL55297.1 copper amine oxidase N-terminal domain-containing protein [Paenibacillus tritici]